MSNRTDVQRRAEAAEEDAVIRGRVKVSLVELGESLFGGDYEPQDPEDAEVLRFDFYGLLNGVWVPCLDASYCTQISVSATRTERRALLERLWDEGAGSVEGGVGDVAAQHGSEAAAAVVTEIWPRRRRCFEALSWISSS